jgi:hypothetical protein
MALLSRLKRRFGLFTDVVRFYYTRHVKGFEPPSRPLLDDATTKWLQNQLKITKLFLEFGSGGSTLLANGLGVRTISVESDAYYAAVVRSALQHPGTTEILTPKMGFTGQWGVPVFFKRRKGPRYVTAPFQRFHGEFPDLIFIDGRYRVACVLHSANQAARAGAKSKLLIDDYVARPAYHALEKYLGPPERIGRAAMFVLGDREIPDEIRHKHLTDVR